MGWFGTQVLDTVDGLKKIPAYFSYLQELKKFSDMSIKANRLIPNKADSLPCLDDRVTKTGFDSHYLYHVAWASRAVSQIRPDRHVDISSSLNFCTTVSAFIPVEFYDYRPAQLKLSGLVSRHADLMSLPFESGRVTSLSCMHVIEHIGLGRYGDPLDPDGDNKAARELKRVLARGGDLLIVVPVGKPRVVFNAHRIYSFDEVLGMFPGLRLKEYALITDHQPSDGIVYGASKELSDEQSYGCGCFWFKN